MKLSNDDEAAPELNLWRSALALFVADAMDYLKRPHNSPSKRKFQKQAFDDLCANGQMTRRLCTYADRESVWLSEGFRKYVQDYYKHH